jgi:hypothetical protein
MDNILITYAEGNFVEIKQPSKNKNHPEILEEIFAGFNAGSGQEHPKFTRELRSLSIGDFVTINNSNYECDLIGWKPITTAELLTEVKNKKFNPFTQLVLAEKTQLPNLHKGQWPQYTKLNPIEELANSIKQQKT